MSGAVFVRESPMPLEVARPGRRSLRVASARPVGIVQ